MSSEISERAQLSGSFAPRCANLWRRDSALARVVESTDATHSSHVGHDQSVTRAECPGCAPDASVGSGAASPGDRSISLRIIPGYGERSAPHSGPSAVLDNRGAETTVRPHLIRQDEHGGASDNSGAIPTPRIPTITSPGVIAYPRSLAMAP